MWKSLKLSLVPTIPVFYDSWFWQVNGRQTSRCINCWKCTVLCIRLYFPLRSHLFFISRKVHKMKVQLYNFCSYFKHLLNTRSLYTLQVISYLTETFASFQDQIFTEKLVYAFNAKSSVQSSTHVFCSGAQLR